MTLVRRPCIKITRMTATTVHMMVFLMFMLLPVLVLGASDDGYFHDGHHQRIHYWDILMDRPWGTHKSTGKLPQGAACTDNNQCASGGCKSGQCCVAITDTEFPGGTCMPGNLPCCGGCALWANSDGGGGYVCVCSGVGRFQANVCATDQDCCLEGTLRPTCALIGGYKNCCLPPGSVASSPSECCSGSASRGPCD